MNFISRYTNGYASPWKIHESDFPEDGTSFDRLKFILNYAVLAPSVYNTQPWLFGISGNEISLLADRSRGLPVLDPEDRLLILSCGAALLNLRVALERFDMHPRVKTFPELSQPELLAYIQVSTARHVRGSMAELFPAIPRTRFSKKPMESNRIPSEILEKLAGEASLEGAALHELPTSADHDELVHLIALSDQKQRMDRHFKRELEVWTHPNRLRSRDGYPEAGTDSLGRRPTDGVYAVRTFNVGKGHPANEMNLKSDPARYLLLSTVSDSHADWLTAGQAIQRVLLRSTLHGLTFSYMNQPIEDPILRRRLADTFGVRQTPQILLRIGYGQRSRYTPLRPLKEVLITRDSDG